MGRKPPSGPSNNRFPFRNQQELLSYWFPAPGGRCCPTPATHDFVFEFQALSTSDTSHYNGLGAFHGNFSRTGGRVAVCLFIYWFVWPQIFFVMFGCFEHLVAYFFYFYFYFLFNAISCQPVPLFFS